MRNYHDYTVITPIPLTGGIAVAGDTVPLTARQAKYLVLAGKIRPAETKQKTTRKKKSKQEE